MFYSAKNGHKMFLLITTDYAVKSGKLLLKYVISIIVQDLIEQNCLLPQLMTEGPILPTAAFALGKVKLPFSYCKHMPGHFGLSDALASPTPPFPIPHLSTEVPGAEFDAWSVVCSSKSKISFLWIDPVTHINTNSGDIHFSFLTAT